MQETAKVYPDGRIMVPFRLRRLLGLTPGAQFYYEVEEGKLTIWNPDNLCKCGSRIDYDNPIATKAGLCRGCLELAAETYSKAESKS